MAAARSHQQIEIPRQTSAPTAQRSRFNARCSLGVQLELGAFHSLPCPCYLSSIVRAIWRYSLPLCISSGHTRLQQYGRGAEYQTTCVLASQHMNPASRLSTRHPPEHLARPTSSQHFNEQTRRAPEFRIHKSAMAHPHPHILMTLAATKQQVVTCKGDIKRMQKRNQGGRNRKMKSEKNTVEECKSNRGDVKTCKPEKKS